MVANTSLLIVIGYVSDSVAWFTVLRYLNVISFLTMGATGVARAKKTPGGIPPMNQSVYFFMDTIFNSVRHCSRLNELGRRVLFYMNSVRSTGGLVSVGKKFFYKIPLSFSNDLYTNVTTHGTAVVQTSFRLRVHSVVVPIDNTVEPIFRPRRRRGHSVRDASGVPFAL